jgi:TubC N-terminal docking domain
LSARALLEELRVREVHLEADGLILRVDAPAEADTGELRTKLCEHKRGLIRLLESERKRLEDADRRGLVIRWSREPGWISLHDPTSGEWHDVKASECLPTVVDTARANRRRKRSRGV